MLVTAYPQAVALVIDLLLPDLTGQKLLQRFVKEERKLPPVIVMSGVFRGQQQQEKVRAICDLAGWYEKPFDASRLVAQLATLAGIAPVVRSEPKKVADDLECSITEGTPVSGDLISDAHPVIDTRDLEEKTLADDDEEFGEFDIPTVIEETGDLSQAEPGGHDLSKTTVPSVLAAVYAAQETAEIVFERGPERIKLTFERGRPVHASSGLKKDGDARAIVRRLIGWSAGWYRVGFKVEAHGPKSMSLHPASLILEGVRELFAVERLRALVPPKLRPMPSPSSPFALYELPLTDDEAMMLLLTTGQRSVEAIVREMSKRTGERETLAALYSLLTLGVLVDVLAVP